MMKETDLKPASPGKTISTCVDVMLRVVLLLLDVALAGNDLHRVSEPFISCYMYSTFNLRKMSSQSSELKFDSLSDT